jgi:uncharacterized protein YggE
MGIRDLAGAALLFVAAIAPATASAQAAGAVSPGGIELHLMATGESVNHADYVTFYVPISTTGENASAARSANSAAIAALTSALVSRGVDRAAITLLPASTRFGFVGNAAYDPDIPQVPPGSAAAMKRKSAFSTLQIRLSDPALFRRVQDALDEQNQAMIGAPSCSLKDDRAAKNAAISDALAKARQDAEAYAAPLGLRVDRITSVSNFGDANSAIPDANFLTRMMFGVPEDSADSVTTSAQVLVDFVLVPR